MADQPLQELARRTWVYVCPECGRSWHKSTGKPRNNCVGNGRVRHVEAKMVPVEVVPLADAEKLARALDHYAIRVGGIASVALAEFRAVHPRPSLEDRVEEMRGLARARAEAAESMREEGQP